jgi:hypothetical protein
MGAEDPRPQVTPDATGTADLVRRRRNRNLALLAVLLGFVVIIYVLSFVKMGGG